MKLPVTITVNGRPFHEQVEPRLLLVHFLRDVVGLTGTKIRCDTSQCGACTIQLGGTAVKPCTCLAVQADGRRVTAIEGVARDGQLPCKRRFGTSTGCNADSALLGDDVTGDIYASAEYRRAMAPVFVRQAIAAALARTGTA